MARAAADLHELRFESSAPAGSVRGVSRETPDQCGLWLALEFPKLALDAVARGCDGSMALAVVDGSGPRGVLVAVNAEAETQGINRGMTAGTAGAVDPRLRLIERDREAEQGALQGLAAWMGQFSSCVSLVPPRGLLVEVGGSLRLFGGLSTLRGKLREGVAALGYGVREGIAPTPLAACLLARVDGNQPVTVVAALRARLATMSLACTDLPDTTVAALARMGVKRVADCLRLPRDGLARRFGPELLDYLDRLLGVRPDPRKPYQAPPKFERLLPLPVPVEGREALHFAAHRLLLELGGWLRARSEGVRAVEIHLIHEGGAATRLAIGLVAPNRDPRHLLRLLDERLDRLELPGAVEALGLRAVDLAPLAPRSGDLYEDVAEQAREGWATLVERLRAKLGRDAVRGIKTHDDHRPEYAWRMVEPGQGGVSEAVAEDASEAGGRPLWLLTPSRALGVRDGAPWIDGKLRLMRGPECIESGWWDVRDPGKTSDIARDYFVAESSSGRRYWIYRERNGARRWWLHGVFA